jgi:outer membrane protein
MTDRLKKGSATMSEDAQRALNNDIQNKSKDLKRFGEDSQTEMDNDEAKVTQEIQQKMGPLVAKYAIDNNFAVVLDVGQQSPVLWAASATNIEDVVVALYDQSHPVSDAAPAAPKAAPTAAPAKPPVKKQ